MATETAATTEPVVQQGRWPQMKHNRPMSLGLMLPIAEQNAVANDSPRDGFWDTVAMAKLAIDIGFDMLWLPDHFILKLERHGGEARGVWECWTTAAGIAAALPGTPIGTMVAATSFHNPGSIAKMAENIDEISRGNFVLGLGCGWHADEYHMYGLPYDHRVDRFEEALQIISPLVRTGRATFGVARSSAFRCAKRARNAFCNGDAMMPSTGMDPAPWNFRRSPVAAEFYRALFRGLDGQNRHRDGGLTERETRSARLIYLEVIKLEEVMAERQHKRGSLRQLVISLQDS